MYTSVPYWLHDMLFSVSMYEIRETLTAIVNFGWIVDIALDQHGDGHELLMLIGLLVGGDDDDRHEVLT